MRYPIFITLLLSMLGCQEPVPVASLGDIIAPSVAGEESLPIVYQHYDEIAPIFSQRNDTTYVINFWATWCKPCLEELPLLNSLQRQYDDAALRVVLVSLDTETRAIARIPEYLNRRGIDLPTIVLTDERPSWMRDLDGNWNGALPTTFIYRNDLRYIYRRNFRTLPDVQEAVAPLIGL
ncbi:thiol-disulfide isomerase/thioredoxin [Lewinella aquimaris]|uniref:Thiol-disulfide isomerase/thioredoxin n=1 Tax=Neolewinella aquimaris TaxID=1835722 RepID=A0A840E0N8_9BACT|nr:TlpA disulfide reductase family protein [Neolewinella aquimaris]MBB4078700.1 thiol-disulfide isomerase/thioredoxin [Neolewinella aquimaris]